MTDVVPEGVPEPPGWREEIKSKAVSFICDTCGIEGGIGYLQKDVFDGGPCMSPACEDGTWHVQYGQDPDTDYWATVKALGGRGPPRVEGARSLNQDGDEA